MAFAPLILQLDKDNQVAHVTEALATAIRSLGLDKLVEFCSPSGSAKVELRFSDEAGQVDYQSIREQAGRVAVNFCATIPGIEK